MDEPTASLDFGNQALILNEILRLKASGRSVLFCSHDPDHALQCADRALLLHRGNVLALGTPARDHHGGNLKTLYGVEVELIESPVAWPRRFAGRRCSRILGSTFPMCLACRPHHFLKEPAMHYLLMYDAAEDYATARAPYRKAHLLHAMAAHQRGEIILAGAYANPADGALLVFQGRFAEGR